MWGAVPRGTATQDGWHYESNEDCDGDGLQRISIASRDVRTTTH